MRNSLPMLIGLAVLLGACAAPSTTPLAPSIVAPPQRPPLPPIARQPQRPPECSPTCLEDATSEAMRAQLSVMKLMPPALAASRPTK